jgi:hypothetical protein
MITLMRKIQSRIEKNTLQKTPARVRQRESKQADANAAQSIKNGVSTRAFICSIYIHCHDMTAVSSSLIKKNSSQEDVDVVHVSSPHRLPSPSNARAVADSHDHGGFDRRAGARLFPCRNHSLCSPSDKVSFRHA